MRIAIAGKGGVGKTTFAALLINVFREKGPRPVLVVDADPNSNLHVLLGIKYEKTIADIREDVKNEQPPAGMSRPQYFALSVEESIIEKDSMDFIAIGHPEGRECYCSVNHILRDFLEKMSMRYPVEVIDNEAGMEHMSRQTDGKVDWLIFVANKDKVSLSSVKNSIALLGKLKVTAAHTGLVLNKTEKIPAFANELGVEILGVIPYDDEIEKAAEEGEILKKVLPPTRKIIDVIAERINQNKGVE
ncbi:MAG: AAA family ATPase [bacterium]